MSGRSTARSGVASVPVGSGDRAAAARRPMVEREDAHQASACWISALAAASASGSFSGRARRPGPSCRARRRHRPRPAPRRRTTSPRVHPPLDHRRRNVGDEVHAASSAEPSTTADSPSFWRTPSESSSSASGRCPRQPGLDDPRPPRPPRRRRPARRPRRGPAASAASPSSFTRSPRSLDRGDHLVLGHPQQRRELVEPRCARGRARRPPGR